MHPALYRVDPLDQEADIALLPFPGATHWPKAKPGKPLRVKAQPVMPTLPARATTSKAVLTVLWQRRPGAMTAQELAKLLPEELDTRAVSNALCWLFQHGYVTHPEDEVFGMPYHWRIAA